MKSYPIHKPILLVSLLFSLSFGRISAQDLEPAQQPGVKYSGLTKTLGSLLKTKTTRSFTLGANEIALENLIDADFAELFDCDSVISAYLDEAGDQASYEMLSDIMRNTIWEHFRDDDGDISVYVTSDTITDGMYFNISLSRNRTVSLPIVLLASDTLFSTSFDTTATLEFDADIDIFINAGMVNSGNEGQGLKIRINKFAFELSSGSDVEEQADMGESSSQEDPGFPAILEDVETMIPFCIQGKMYKAITRSFSIDVGMYCYLEPLDATDFIVDEGESYTLSYEDLEQGNFKWYNGGYGWFATDLVMIPEDEPWDSITYSDHSNEFNYRVDDIFDDDGLEQISLCCETYVKEGVTARRKKYVLGE